MKEPRAATRSGSGKKIWIDLDNSPHVPFFLPIIEALKERGHTVVLSARDSYQVCELLKLHNISCQVLGSHWGRNRLLKIVGTCWRSLQLMPLAWREKPDLAVSHGSRAQMIASSLLGIPAVMIMDYEFTAKVNWAKPDWVFVPELIPCSQAPKSARGVLQYPGLKEDVYVPGLHLDGSLKKQLGLNGNELIVTVRPPATEAHYHDARSEALLDATLEMLTQRPDTRVILLPRTDKQSKALRKQWGQWIDNHKVVIPEHAVDGLNLIWFSDLVISGGGTMNREAAALGVPVYSIFRGRIGAVDRHLANTGRLTLIETVEDVRSKIHLQRRPQTNGNAHHANAALRTIVDGIVSIAEQKCLPVHS